MRATGWLTCGLLITLWSIAPAQAQPLEPDVIVGRADADASGAWPVMLWVREGARSRVVVRAPRSQLGDLPWKPADAGALMHLERFGAPRLEQRMDAHPCSTNLAWGRVLHPPNAHWRGEREALAHPTCGTADCSGQAWQLEHPMVEGDGLPLARLMPGLAVDRPEWLVLHVVSSAQMPALEGLPQLRVPVSLRWDRPYESWDRDVFPDQAAGRFPAIHAAMLEHLAAAQGLARSSVLMRSDAVSSVEPSGYVRSWIPSPAQRMALGLDDPALSSRHIARLLLRLQPGQHPAVLRLENVDWRSAGLRGALYALSPWPVDAPACRRAVAAWNCRASCTQRLASWPAELKWGFLADESARAVRPADRPAACMKSCEAQRTALASDLDGRIEAVAQRQRHAWAWIEELTGRSAADWMAH